MHKIPLHIPLWGRTKEDYARLAEHYARMAQINPNGFRKFPKKPRQGNLSTLAERYAARAGMY